MCHEVLCKLSQRNKRETSAAKRRKLRKIFKELANRCGSLHLDRDQFLRLTGLPGLLGEQVFNALDEDEDNKLDVKEFVIGVCVIYEGDLNTIGDFLFKIFNFSKYGQISRNDVNCIFEYLPNFCRKCERFIKPQWNIEDKIEELFLQHKNLYYEDFLERMNESNELCELLLMNIINFMPQIFDLVFVSKAHSETLVESVLQYKGRDYYMILRDKSIIYSLRKGSAIKGIILASDLFVEIINDKKFCVKNNRYSYEFTANSVDLLEKWVEKLKIVSNYRDIKSDYDISKIVIGKGAYGKVKLATKKFSEATEQVAVKIISKEPLDNRSETRLRREISILNFCKHENIVQFKDIYETSKKLYIITEYIQGGSLFSWLKQRSFKIDEEFSKNIIYQISKAVSYLHTYGIIHRDIKLENILLDTSNGIKPKLIDFGLSCILGPGQSSQEAVGTLKYASPELISRIPYRETPDIWGIGVIFYILLIGKIPFYGENDQEIANRILKKKIDVENDRWAGVSEDAKQLVVKLLTRKASERIKMIEILSHSYFSCFF